MSDDRLGTFGFDRGKLQTLAIDLRVEAPAWMESIGPGIAKLLRQQLPDLDEVTIGRVLLALTTEPGYVLASHFDQREPAGKQAARAIWQGLIAAGLHLSEPEWKPQR